MIRNIDELKREYDSGNYGGATHIHLIKDIRSLTDLGLKDAKEMADSWRSQYIPTTTSYDTRVTPHANTPATPAPFGWDPMGIVPTTPTPFEWPGKNVIAIGDVNNLVGAFLEYARDGFRSKIQIIKIVKEVTGVGLKEAKQIVDGWDDRFKGSNQSFEF